MLTEAIMAGTIMLLVSVGICVAGCIYEKKYMSLITTAQNFGGSLHWSVAMKEVGTDPELKVYTVDTSGTNTWQGNEKLRWLLILCIY